MVHKKSLLGRGPDLMTVPFQVCTTINRSAYNLKKKKKRHRSLKLTPKNGFLRPRLGSWNFIFHQHPRVPAIIGQWPPFEDYWLIRIKPSRFEGSGHLFRGPPGLLMSREFPPENSALGAWQIWWSPWLGKKPPGNKLVRGPGLGKCSLVTLLQKGSQGTSFTVPSVSNAGRALGILL